MTSKTQSPQKMKALDSLEEELLEQIPKETHLQAQEQVSERRRGGGGNNSQAKETVVKRLYEIKLTTDEKIGLLQAILRQKKQNYTKPELYNLVLEKGLATFKELQKF